MGRVLAGAVISRFMREKLINYVARLRQADLVGLGELLASGKVRAVIDRRYALSDASQAFRYLAEGHARGKVVVTVGATA
jgi:NADPH:quinone reductase-like Zn-dependent oxidoreductase